jgi:hypothetical protein
MYPDRPETWSVHTPAQFQKLTGTGAFDAMATSQLCALIDNLLGPGRWHRGQVVGAAGLRGLESVAMPVAA